MTKRSECNCLCHNLQDGLTVAHVAPCCYTDNGADEMPPAKFDTVCPYCHKAITVQWRNGLIFDRERYDLIADWLYHRECWDKQVTDMEKL